MGNNQSLPHLSTCQNYCENKIFTSPLHIETKIIPLFFSLQLHCNNCISTFFFILLGLHLKHMEVPRLGVKSELQLLAYTTATGTLDLKCICELCCSLWQCHILNPLSKARDGNCILKDAMSGSLPGEPQQEIHISTS